MNGPSHRVTKPIDENTSSAVPRRGVLARYVDRFRKEPPSSPEERSAAANSKSPGKDARQDGVSCSKPTRLGSTSKTGTAFRGVGATKRGSASNYEKKVNGSLKTTRSSLNGVGSKQVGRHTPLVPAEVKEDEEMLRQLAKLRTALGKRQKQNPLKISNPGTNVAVVRNPDTGKQPKVKGNAEKNTNRIKTLHAACDREEFGSRTARTTLGIFDSLSTRSSASSSASTWSSDSSAQSESDTSFSKPSFKHRKHTESAASDILTETAQTSDDNTSSKTADFNASSFQSSQRRNRNDRTVNSGERKDAMLRVPLANVYAKNVDNDRLDIQTEHILDRIGALSHSKPINTLLQTSYGRSECPSAVDASQRSVMVVSPSEILRQNPQEVLDELRRRYGLNRSYGVTDAKNPKEGHTKAHSAILNEPIRTESNRTGRWNRFSFSLDGKPATSSYDANVPFGSEIEQPFENTLGGTSIKPCASHFLKQPPHRPATPKEETEILQKCISNRALAHAASCISPPSPEKDKQKISTKNPFCIPESENMTCRRDPEGKFYGRRGEVRTARNPEIPKNVLNSDDADDAYAAKSAVVFTDGTIFHEQKRIDTTVSSRQECQSSVDSGTQTEEVGTPRSGYRFAQLEKSLQAPEGDVENGNGGRMELSSVEETPRVLQLKSQLRRTNSDGPLTIGATNKLSDIGIAAQRETCLNITAPESRTTSQERDKPEHWTIRDPVGDSTNRDSPERRTSEEVCGDPEATYFELRSPLDTSSSKVDRSAATKPETSERELQEVLSGLTLTQKQPVPGTREVEQTPVNGMPCRTGSADLDNNGTVTIGEMNVEPGSPDGVIRTDVRETSVRNDQNENDETTEIVHGDTNGISEIETVEKRTLCLNGERKNTDDIRMRLKEQSSSPKFEEDPTERNEKKYVFDEEDRNSDVAEGTETNETTEQPTEVVVFVDDMLHLLRERLRGFEDELRLVDGEIYDLEVHKMIYAANMM